MEYSELTAQLRSRGELLLSGQIEELVASYIYPLPIYLQSRCMVLNTPFDAYLVFDFLRTALLERGVVSLRPQVNAVELPRGGRFRVWIDWHELAYPVEETRKSSVIYYCRQTSLGPRAEMVDYTLMSMPELDQQFAALAMSA
ncbi:hypothetical protein [Tabrizicola thermarum]|uniref:hypothetical protein n=1 Tax=Tabrizicola thermarum TaxID=2670345 RepID=UPI000FFC791B|nr:hypothetical protein [Tabrizicola thermarum]